MREILTHRIFMGLTLLMSLAYLLIISFNTFGPFLLQVQMHYSPVFFGHFALWLGVTFLAATFVCRYALKKYNVDRLFFIIVNGFFFNLDTRFKLLF